MFSIFLVGTDLIQKFYVSLILKVYAGFIKGSSVYMQVGFSKVANTFWCMLFEVAAGFEWWCKFLGPTQCFGDNDLTIQINWLLVHVVWKLWWVQYEKFDEMRPSCVFWCGRSMQYENLWNVVLRRREKVVAFCRLAPT